MSLPHAILGLLNYMPMSGYELKRFFDDSINFFWSAQTSQIYRELKKLEGKGYVASKEETSDKGPKKRIYRVTKKGESHLKEWLADMPKKIDEDNRNAFLLRVMLLSNLGVDELAAQIAKRLEKYRMDLKAVQAVEGRLQDYLRMTGRSDAPVFWRITLSRGFHDLRSHIAWAEEALRELKAEVKRKS